jgi:hypothetical protein
MWARFVRPDVYEGQGDWTPEPLYYLENIPEIALFA